MARRSVYARALRPVEARDIADSDASIIVGEPEAWDVPTPLLPSLPLLEGFERFRREVQVTPEQRVVRLQDVAYFPDYKVCVDWRTKRLLTDGLTSRNNRLPPPGEILSPPAVTVVGPVVPFRTNSIGYLHSLLDDLPRALLADRLVPSDLPIDMLYTPPLHDVEQFVLSRSLSARCRLVPTEPGRKYLLREAWIPSTLSGGQSLHPPRWYSDLLYGLGKAETAGPSPKLVILSRSSALRRRMTNEGQLADALSELGFHIVSLGSQPIWQQAAIMQGAEVVVSPHGADLGNLVFARKARIIEMFSSCAVHPLFYILAASLGLEWDYVLGPGSTRHSDFDAPIERIRDLARRAVSAND